MFIYGLRNARFTGVCSRISKLIEEKQEISVQDPGNECVRMETIMSDNIMIQNNTEEYGYIRKVEVSPYKKEYSHTFPERKTANTLLAVC